MNKLTSRFDGKKITAAFGAAAFTLMNAVPVFAADETIIDNIEAILTTYYGRISEIAIGIGLLCAVVAVIIMVASPSDRGAETGKRWLVRILLGIAILLSIGGIYSLIQNLTGNETVEMNNIINHTNGVQ